MRLPGKITIGFILGPVVLVALSWTLATIVGPWLVLLLGPPSQRSYFHQYLGAITDAQSLTVVAMVLLALSGQFVHIRKRPRLLAILFAVFLSQMLVAFAAQDLWEAHSARGSEICFSVGQAVRKTDGTVLQTTGANFTSTDAIYFAIGNFTTAGTGSIAPVSESCRGLVAHQTALGAIALLLGVAGLASILANKPT